MWLSQYSCLYFPATKRSPTGNRLKWQISLQWCTHGWESHLRVVLKITHWFPGLIILVGSGRVLPPSLALSESAQVSVWIDMAVSFFCSIFSVPPLYLFRCLHTCTPSTFILKSSCLCPSFVTDILCCSFACSTALASLCWHCGYSRALKPWNTNIAHIAWASSIGLLSGILKNEKTRQELASLSSQLAK